MLVLIVAKCNVNVFNVIVLNEKYIVLIVAKCNVNATKKKYLKKKIECINSSKV